MRTIVEMRQKYLGFGTVLLLLGGLLWSTWAPALAAEQEHETVVTVTHGATGTTLASPNSDGHQLGDLRVVSLPTQDESGQRGRLDSTLITTGIDTPGPGDEVRIGQLVFSFGSAGDQIYVGGTAVYPGKGSTIAPESSAIRPILGGAGKYQGATGWCQTEHLADGSWRHIFHLTGGTAGQESEATQAAPSTGIIRSELGNALPATAPGQTLSLWHYSIPAGSKLIPHKHPGWQVARIIAGQLQYTVVSGEASVLHNDGRKEQIGAGGVVMLNTGDSVVENPALEHFGANLGPAEVEIYAASIFETGLPPAITMP